MATEPSEQDIVTARVLTRGCFDWCNCEQCLASQSRKRLQIAEALAAAREEGLEQARLAIAAYADEHELAVETGAVNPDRQFGEGFDWAMECAERVVRQLKTQPPPPTAQGEKGE